MELRPLVAADVPAMWRINEAGLPGTGRITEAALEDMLSYAELAVGAFEDELLGYVLCLPPRTRYGSLNYAWFNENFADFLYVDLIAVAPEHRDRGIGSELYRRVAAHGDSPVAAEVSLDPPNPASMRFHQRHGFERIGELEHADYSVNLMLRPVEHLAIVRQRLRGLCEAAAETDDPLSWFEELYATADDSEDIPWARMEANPEMVEWVAAHPEVKGRALVIGCGLGDDAEWLAAAGFEVTAFDLSESCIEWCRKRFPNSGVDYQVADLFDLPKDWKFDLVVEIHILQALPEEIRDEASQKLIPLLAEGGHLFCVGRLAGLREPDEPPPPWPLTRTWLEGRFSELGAVTWRHFVREDTPGIDRYVAAWKC